MGRSKAGMFSLGGGGGLTEALTGLGDWSSKGFGYQTCEGKGKKDKQNQCNFMTTGKSAKDGGKLGWLKEHADAVYGTNGPYKNTGSHYPYYHTWFGSA